MSCAWTAAEIWTERNFTYKNFSPSMELETTSVKVMRIFLLPKYLTHFMCLVLKMVAKEFSLTLNQGFRHRFYVLWTPLPSSRPLYLNNLHHNVPCAPGTIIFNFNLWLTLILTLLKERQNLLKDLIIFNLQRMNLIHLEEYFTLSFLCQVLLGFSSFGGREERESYKKKKESSWP